MYSLAQKRMMAKQAGEDVIVLTAEEVEFLLANQDELIESAQNLVDYLTVEQIMVRMQDNDTWKGSYRRFLAPETQNEAGGCTVTMLEAENMLAELSGLDVLIAEIMEFAPEDVIDEVTNCPECEKHPYECECE